MDRNVMEVQFGSRTGTIGQQSMQETQPFNVPMTQQSGNGGTNSGSDSLYRRGPFRKATREKAVAEAPRNSSGSMICPTCGEVIPEKIVINTKNGLRERVGYDLDHYPVTWAERVDIMRASDTPPTRKEVLDEYNSNVRVQCPTCNQSHKFEGVKGAFADGE